MAERNVGVAHFLPQECLVMWRTQEKYIWVGRNRSIWKIAPLKLMVPISGLQSTVLNFLVPREQFYYTKRKMTSLQHLHPKYFILLSITKPVIEKTQFHSFISLTPDTCRMSQPQEKVKKTLPSFHRYVCPPLNDPNKPKMEKNPFPCATFRH